MTASAQVPGWEVRQLDVVETITDQATADHFLDDVGGVELTVENDTTDVRAVIDIAGGGGTFGVK